uniref:Putative zinc finger protein CONSTANS-LIKE 1-like isoform X2 n=1 Tax=Davidia involucrata TaxID=16924 RepID=A0A5B7AKB8_DAVIN
MKKCELCNSIARIYCDSDQASLCWDCDEKVHTANFIVTKHSRTLLCHACQSPTPWTGSGTKLGPTVSVCDSCVRSSNNNNNDNDEDDDVDVDVDSEDHTDEDDDGDGDEDDGENQVVPLSYTSLPPPPPPPPLVSNSSRSEESSSSSRLYSTGREGLSRSTITFSSKRTRESTADLCSQGTGASGENSDHKIGSCSW